MRWFSPVVVALLLVLLPPRATTAQDRGQEVRPGPGATWSIAAVGDAIITRRIMQFDHDGDPRFQGLVELIQAADAALVNLELSLFRLEEFTGWPQAEYGGNWELAPPEVALDLRDMGFDLYNRANNHTTDLGVEGMRLTDRLLDSLGLTHSGTGMNLGFASRPGYFESPKGRIALIGFATTFTPMSRAANPRGPYRGRPGLNALRTSDRYEVAPAAFQTLRAAITEMGADVPEDPEAPLRLFGIRVYRGSENRVVTTLDEHDRTRILSEIRNAADQADFVVVNSHSHQPGNSSVRTTEWLRAFAKACLDAGAVMYAVHGPHQLRGIEVHDGKPIFYSLGNFIFQNETIDPMPRDNYEIYDLDENALAADLYNARFGFDEYGNPTTGFPTTAIWYESVVAVPTFQGQRMVDLKLYPIELGHEQPRSQRGTPRLADAEKGRWIIERLAELSAEFGTRIVYRNGIGVWVP
jgi:poly-gamma-glutamate synthesis protein (capsule biosynthesis protein)